MVGLICGSSRQLHRGVDRGAQRAVAHRDEGAAANDGRRRSPSVVGHRADEGDRRARDDAGPLDASQLRIAFDPEPLSPGP